MIFKKYLFICFLFIFSPAELSLVARAGATFQLQRKGF